jgi:hypothetical protein
MSVLKIHNYKVERFQPTGELGWVIATMDCDSFGLKFFWFDERKPKNICCMLHFY